MALDDLIEADRARAGGAAATPQPSGEDKEAEKTTPPKKPYRPGQRARRAAGKRAEAEAKASGTAGVSQSSTSSETVLRGEGAAPSTEAGSASPPAP
eukprot:10481482-Alexandrium_andersonii.AAC.1